MSKWNETTSNVRLAAHNLGLGTFVSGTDDKDFVLRTLGEGVALLLEHPEKRGKVTVSFMDPETKAVTVFEITSTEGPRPDNKIGLGVTQIQ
jgi:hypothetical protein